MELLLSPIFMRQRVGADFLNMTAMPLAAFRTYTPCYSIKIQHVRFTVPAFLIPTITET